MLFPRPLGFLIVAALFGPPMLSQAGTRVKDDAPTARTQTRAQEGLPPYGLLRKSIDPLATPPIAIPR